MATPGKTTGSTDPKYWDERFEELRHLVSSAATAAAAASSKADDVRHELGGKIDAVNASVSKLASAKLLQQAFTGLVLGGALTVLVKVLGG